MPASSNKATTTTGITTAIAVLPPADRPVEDGFCLLGCVANEVDEEEAEFVPEVSVGCSLFGFDTIEVMITVEGAGVSPAVWGGVTIDVMISVDGGIEDAVVVRVSRGGAEEAGVDGRGDEDGGGGGALDEGGGGGVDEGRLTGDDDGGSVGGVVTVPLLDDMAASVEKRSEDADERKGKTAVITVLERR